MNVRAPFALEAVLGAIHRHLQARHVCTLATSQHDTPWAATCFYVSRDLDLFVCQGKTTRTLANLLANPRGAFAVDDRQANAWLQGIGVATLVSAQDESWAREQLRKVAPEFRAHFDNPDHPVFLLRVDEVTFADRPNGIYPRQHLVFHDGQWELTDAKS